MSKGPRLNNISRNFTPRDSLGIEGVVNSISGEICPVVSTVTPRAFYWAFLTWCFYDFYKDCDPKDRNTDNVYRYAKMINYYFALASCIDKTNITNGFVGSDTISSSVDFNQKEFTYNEKYLKNLLSTMGYYPAGLLTMKFIIDNDPETGEKLKYTHITKEGKELAIAFDKIFSTTKFYKEYRKNVINVPKEVLVELGKIVNIELNGFDEVKEILIDNLFNRKQQQKLIESHNYLKYIVKEIKPTNYNLPTYRKILFYTFSPLSKDKIEYPIEYKEIANSWEIMIGRQYFTVGLEMIWKYMIESLNSPKNYKLWINDCINDSNISFDLENNLSNIISSCDYSFEEIERMVSDARSKNNNHEFNIESGIKIILFIYNRFHDRKDFSTENLNYYNYGIDNNSISFNECFKLIDEYKDKAIGDFIKYIMHYYLLNQHMNVAFEKMLQGRDGYFIEKIEDKYRRKEYFDFDFQRNRMIQLTTVMTDLELLEVE